MYLWPTIARTEPCTLQRYSYALAKHWLAKPDDLNSPIAVFDFAGRLNTAPAENNFGNPYFSLPLEAIDWNDAEIEKARMVTTCELLPQDMYSPYPPSAKKSGQSMLAMLKEAYQSHEARSPAAPSLPFWSTFDNGQDFFVLESQPVFQRAAHSANRQDVSIANRLPNRLFDPEARYEADVFAEYVLNPPPVYDELMNLVMPNDYEALFPHGEVVMIRSAICVCERNGVRDYKHRLLQMHRMPSSLI